MSLESQVRVEDRGAVRWIVIDRPQTRNGLSLPVVERFAELFRQAAEDDAVRVVVLTGAGGAFCSGLDLKDALQTGHVDFAGGLAKFHAVIRAIRAVPKPTIAAVDGAAAGFGADMALACDLRVASSRARLGERFVGIGLMPDGGGTFFLTRIVGLAKAYELVYEGRMVEAEEGLALGLWNRLLPVDDFAGAVQAYAETLAKGPPLAFAYSKRAIQLAAGDLDASLAAEGEGQLALLESQDFTEGVQAFFTKREPRFRGR